MSKQRHRRRSQGGTSPETTPQTGSGVAHFSVSEVFQFSMSVDSLGMGMRGGMGMGMGMPGFGTSLDALRTAPDFDRAFLVQMIAHHRMGG